MRSARRTGFGLWAVLCLMLPQAAGAQLALGPEAPRFGPASPEAEIGEPVEWVLEIVHAHRDRPKIVSQPLAERLGPNWVFVSGPEILTLADGQATDRDRSRFTWRLMALEPGEQSAPPVTLQGKSGEQLEVLGEPLVVRTALADGEDQARPFAEFHDVKGGQMGSMDKLLGVLIGLSVLFVAGVVILIVRARRRRRPLPAAAPISPRAALDALVAGRTDDRPGVQRLAFGLTAILRDALAAGEPGATDGEWMGALRASGTLSADRYRRLEALMSTCEKVKYGAQVPTRFAIDELLASAEVLLLATESAATKSAATTTLEPVA